VNFLRAIFHSRNVFPEVLFDNSLYDFKDCHELPILLVQPTTGGIV